MKNIIEKNKKIILLGSTGSIGTQSLEAIEWLNNTTDNCYTVSALGCNSNIELFKEQLIKWKPQYCHISSKYQDELQQFIKNNFSQNEIKLIDRDNNIAYKELFDQCDYNLFINAISGIYGILPTIYSIKPNKIIAMANKEALVCAGDIINRLLLENNSIMLPVDSEHSAIFQAMMSRGENKKINKLWLTASGGPFREFTKEQLENVSLDDAKCHPNWKMGLKITIDSATMANKALEVMEAMTLFNVASEQIEVLIHPQSIVHSGVEFIDNSSILQCSSPDMRLPIQFALTYPYRTKSLIKPLNLLGGHLDFYSPEKDKFPAFHLGIEASKIGGSAKVVFNAANDKANLLFRNGKIKYIDIVKYIEKQLNKHYNQIIKEPSFDEIRHICQDIENSDY